ncbi:MAG: ATP synthase F1 subunit gamma [Elusimicrobia bacterium]|nr:ATP synthase F1 subunit gamma [Elusimicrobiota bacterium]
MASLRDIRRKIKSVKSTEQITKAMKMVAAARMRRSQAAILAARPFAVKMEQLVRGLSALEVAGDIAAGREVHVHEFFEHRSEDLPGCLVLVTADKGLCGAFNSNLIKNSIEWLKGQAGRKVYAVVVGRKGRDFLHRLKGVGLEIVSETAGIFPKVNFTHAELVGKAVIDLYESKKVSSVSIIYNEFKSAAAQQLVKIPLLPIKPFEDAQTASALIDYEFEPDRQVLLEALLPRYLKAQLYRVLLESQAAELAARMNAMDAASKNAKELREALNLGLNRQRQAIITKEIAELVGGAEALAA